MTTPAAADLKPARLRLWSNWLWILAGILGFALLWSSARLIHDQRARREALRSLAQDKATEIANLGASRFNLLVAKTFGPMWDNRLSDATQSIAEIDRVHARGPQCRCRDTLPVTRFFRFDALMESRNSAETESLTKGIERTADGIADSTISRISRRQVEAGMKSAMPVQNIEIVGRYAVFTITRPAPDRPGTKVFGAVMPVGGLAAILFGGFPLATPQDDGPGNVIAVGVPGHAPNPEMHARHMAEHRRLVQLDTLGLGVSADSLAVFGRVADRPYSATATLAPPLQRFHVIVSLMSSQVALPLIMPFMHDRLWLNGVLILATVVVCLFAIGASRRELALARARSDFVAGVSHDLRMPLAQILLASETLTLGRDRNETERSNLMASILREARRLKAMIDNVLLFSRTGAVGVQPHLQPLEVKPLFDAVAESLDLAVADAGQTIEMTTDESLRVVADRALIHQALANLVDNAMKYGPRGQRIRLSARRVVSGIEIAVEDEGPGIPATARSRLFEAYERLARDSTSERTGSGLGLAVVRQIVLACRGSIRIDDSVQGTRVVITLPEAP
jgi:signal transduction histidine kinase